MRPSEQRHPFTALVLLIAIALGSLVFFIFLAQLVGSQIYGLDIFSAMQNGTATLEMQKLFISFYSFGAFIVPPFIYARIRSKTPFSYLDIRIARPLLLFVLTLAIMLCAKPFLEWTIYFNQQMKLPAFMGPVETWMKYKEIEAELLTKQLLVMTSSKDLIINLAIIAVIPAIGEELIFRGCLQKIFTTWTNNPHAGIWIAAILFSAIHFQFYGFIPRMLLGALFGYVFFYSKSILIPILGHFFNNASAVIAAYILQRQGKSLDNITKPEFQVWYLVILSVIFTALLLRIYYKLSFSYNNKPNERKLD